MHLVCLSHRLGYLAILDVLKLVYVWTSGLRGFCRVLMVLVAENASRKLSQASASTQSAMRKHQGQKYVSYLNHYCGMASRDMAAARVLHGIASACAAPAPSEVVGDKKPNEVAHCKTA